MARFTERGDMIASDGLRLRHGAQMMSMSRMNYASSKMAQS